MGRITVMATRIIFIINLTMRPSVHAVFQALRRWSRSRFLSTTSHTKMRLPLFVTAFEDVPVEFTWLALFSAQATLRPAAGRLGCSRRLGGGVHGASTRVCLLVFPNRPMRTLLQSPQIGIGIRPVSKSSTRRNNLMAWRNFAIRTRSFS